MASALLRRSSCRCASSRPLAPDGAIEEEEKEAPATLSPRELRERERAAHAPSRSRSSPLLLPPSPLAMENCEP
jgi:hypothetical protein